MIYCYFWVAPAPDPKIQNFHIPILIPMPLATLPCMKNDIKQSGEKIDSKIQKLRQFTLTLGGICQ